MTKTIEEIIAEARGILAQGYCTKENEKKEVDADLLLAQADLLEAFLKQTLEAKAEEVIKFLKQVDNEKWNDAVHCTCLGYAIDYLEGGESYKERHCEEL